MKYYFLVLLLLLQATVELQARESLVKKVKSKIENGIVKNKIMLDHESIGPDRAEAFNIKESYLTHIEIKTNEQTVYDIDTSSSVLRNPTLFFNFKYKDGDQSTSFTVLTTDNTNTQKEQSFEINRNDKKSNLPLPIDDIKTTKLKQQERNKAVWEATSIEDAIQEVYGTKNLKFISVQSNEIAYTQSIANISIESYEALESIAIFSNTNKMAAIAIINIPKAVKTTEHKLNFSTKTDGELVIIAKNRKGKFYKAIYPIRDVNSDGADPRLSFLINKDGKLNASTSNYY